MNKVRLVTIVLTMLFFKVHGENSCLQEAFGILLFKEDRIDKISLRQLESLSEHLTDAEEDTLKSRLYNQIQQYQFGLSVNELSQYLTESIALSSTPENFNSYDLLRAVADYRFDRLSIYLQEYLRNTHVKPKRHLSMTIKVLELQNYYINIPENNLSKLFKYVRTGRWGHIIRSLTTTHRNKSLMVIAPVFIIFFWIILKKYYS